MTRGAVVIGAAHSELTTEGGADLAALTEKAVRRALDDAGLDDRAVDGLATYGKPAFPAARSDGSTTFGPLALISRMRLDSVRWMVDTETGMVISAIVEARNAIVAGMCDVVVVWRTMALPSGRYGASSRQTVTGPAAYTAPWGADSIVPWHALVYARYLHLAGANDDALARFVVASHRAANDNPSAASIRRPVEEADYLASPFVSDPLRRLDCDRPVAGAAAIVLASTEVADPSLRTAVIAAAALNTRPPAHSLHYTLDDGFEAGRSIARRLWDSSGERPDTVSVAQLYDGFSPTVLYWLESLGFTQRHRAAHELATGEPPLPVNTFGGSLGEGRLHGMGHVIEGFRQVTGRAQARQIEGSRAAVVTVGSPLMSGGGLVLRDE